MKKFLPYLLMLIMLVGFLGPMVRVHAAGNCNIVGITTESECGAEGGFWTNTGLGCSLGNNPKFQNLLQYIVCIINTSVIPLIFALALVIFVWGVVQFVINTDDEVKKTKGKQFMIWGIIALTVMVSVWGLVAILGNTFGVNTGFIPQVKSP